MSTDEASTSRAGAHELPDSSDDSDVSWSPKDCTRRVKKKINPKQSIEENEEDLKAKAEREKRASLIAFNRAYKQALDYSLVGYKHSPSYSDLKQKKFNQNFLYEVPRDRQIDVDLSDDEDQVWWTKDTPFIKMPPLKNNIPSIPGEKYKDVFKNIPIDVKDIQKTKCRKKSPWNATPLKDSSLPFMANVPNNPTYSFLRDIRHKDYFEKDAIKFGEVKVMIQKLSAKEIKYFTKQTSPVKFIQNKKSDALLPGERAINNRILRVALKKISY